MSNEGSKINFVILSASFFILVGWLLPNHYSPWVAAYQDFASFFAGLILLIGVAWFRVVKMPAVFIMFFLLPCIPIVQKITGVIYFGGDALVVVIYLLAFAFMLLVGYSQARHSLGAFVVSKQLAVIFILGAVISVWIALRQWLLLSGSIWVADLPPGGRPFANFAQPNNLATLLCLGVVGVVYFYEKHVLGRVACAVLVLFLLFGIALTQSRTSWVVAVAFLLFWGWKAAVCQVRLRVSVLAGWVGVYCGFILVLPKLADWLLLAHVDPLARALAFERWGMWVQLWQSIWQGPLWGYGWSQVVLAQVAIAMEHPVPLVTEHSHNILLDILLWNGPLLGLAIILAAAAWLLRLGWFARSHESLFAILAAGCILIHGMLEFPLEYGFFLLPLGVLLGMASAEPVWKEYKLPRWVLMACLPLIIGLFVWVWRDYRIVEEDYRLMRYEVARVGDLKAEAKAPDVMLLNQWREFVRFARTEASEGMTKQELDWMRKVSHRYPYSSGLLRYSLALALNGESQEAFRQIHLLKRLHSVENYQSALEELKTMQEKHPQLGVLIDSLERQPE